MGITKELFRGVSYIDDNLKELLEESEDSRIINAILDKKNKQTDNQTDGQQLDDMSLDEILEKLRK